MSYQRGNKKSASKQPPPEEESPMKSASREAMPLPTAVPRSSPYISEKDFIDFFYSPHTLVMMFTLFAVLGWAYVWYHSTSDPVVNIKLGLAAVLFSFLLFALTHFPDGLMVRPHPGVWRVMAGIALVYGLVIVFFLFQDLDMTRKILGYYDPSHLVKLPERSYAEDCRMSTPTQPYKWWNTISDEFLIAHALGYWAKTLVIRDWRVVTALSIGFELVEVTFQHWLPNFKECWWDHVIADVLICNAGGTLLGLITLRLFGAKQYQWVKVSDIHSITGKAGRVFWQFTPRSVEPYKWLMFESFKRYLQVALLLGVMLLQEINCFFMKFVLWQEPKHHLVIGRLMLWGFIALPGLREFYDYISLPTVKRLGMIAWVGSATLILETVWVLKMVIEGGYFRTPMPSFRKTWTASFFLSPLFYSALAILLAICFMGNPDLQWYQEEFNALVEPLCQAYPKYLFWTC